MSPVVVVDPPRADADLTAELAELGVATVCEAIGRRGLLAPSLRPIQTDVTVSGTAVTALCWPGDNLMIHVAVEQCRPGDVLVVTTTSECHDGLFGELLATSLKTRGVRGLIIEAGVRDVADLRRLGFPVWSTDVCAQGTVKRTPGSVNVPVVVGGQLIRPGDAIVADDDGVVVVERLAVPEAVSQGRARVARERSTRAALSSGVLGLDLYDMRPTLERLGVRYVTHPEASPEAGDAPGAGGPTT